MAFTEVSFGFVCDVWDGEGEGKVQGGDKWGMSKTKLNPRY